MRIFKDRRALSQAQMKVGKFELSSPCQGPDHPASLQGLDTAGQIRQCLINFSVMATSVWQLVGTQQGR